MAWVWPIRPDRPVRARFVMSWANSQTHNLIKMSLWSGPIHIIVKRPVAVILPIVDPTEISVDYSSSGPLLDFSSHVYGGYRRSSRGHSDEYVPDPFPLMKNPFQAPFTSTALCLRPSSPSPSSSSLSLRYKTKSHWDKKNFKVRDRSLIQFPLRLCLIRCFNVFSR